MSTTAQCRRHWWLWPWVTVLAACAADPVQESDDGLISIEAAVIEQRVAAARADLERALRTVETLPPELRERWAFLSRAHASNSNGIRAAFSSIDGQTYDRLAVYQRWISESHLPHLFHRHLPARPLAIADLACGTGLSLETLLVYAPADSRILCVDLEAEYLETGKARGLGANVTFLQADLLDPLPLSTESLDVVTSLSGITQYFSRPELQRIFGEVRRVLRPGGVLGFDIRADSALNGSWESAKGFGLHPIVEMARREGFLLLALRPIEHTPVAMRYGIFRRR